MVHEQFMTDTARMADIVLPATMFVEHDDIYQAGGQQHILLGPEAHRSAGRMPQQSRGRLRARPPRRGRASRLRDDAARDHRPRRCATPKRGTLDEARGEHAGSTASRPSSRRISCDGFAWPDGKFRLGRTGRANPYPSPATLRPGRGQMPSFPDHWDGDRGRRRRASVPPGDQPGAQLPQLHLHGDADLARQGGAPDRAHPPDDAGRSASPNGDQGRASQSARRGAAAREALRRAAARRARRRIDLAEQRL